MANFANLKNFQFLHKCVSSCSNSHRKKVSSWIFFVYIFLNSTNIVEVFRAISRPPQIFLAEIWTIYDKIYNQKNDLFRQNCDFVGKFFQNSYYSVYTKIKACNLSFQIKPNLWLDPFPCWDMLDLVINHPYC